jgi:hypothetical protein
MKTRIFAFSLLAAFLYWVAKLLFAEAGISFRVTYVAILMARYIPLFVWPCLLTIHVALGFFIWRDARTRNDLLLSIPDWVWGLIGLTGGVIGLLIHWLANCSKFVKNQTVIPESTTQPNASPGLPKS